MRARCAGDGAINFLEGRMADEASVTYLEYLRLGQLLQAQHPLAPAALGPQVHSAEHFFIGNCSGTRFRIGKGCATAQNGRNRANRADFAPNRLVSGHRTKHVSPFPILNSNMSPSDVST